MNLRLGIRIIKSQRPSTELKVKCFKCNKYVGMCSIVKHLCNKVNDGQDIK